jgi:MipA family protein
MKKQFCKWLLTTIYVGFVFSTASAESDSQLYEQQDATNQLPIEVESPASPARPFKLGVGIQAMVASNPYRGGDTVALVLPMFTYVGERFFVVSPRAGYNILRRPQGGINVIADYRFKGEAFEAEGFLAGMDDRKDTVMAGVEGSIRTYGRCRLELSAMTDVLDRHNGQELNLVLSRIFRREKLSLIPGAGLVWRTADYNDYYYGVKPSEATDERPAYEPGDSLEWFARLLLRYELTDNWSLAGAARLEGLSDELRDSPTVNKNHLTTVFVGLNYFF